MEHHSKDIQIWSQPLRTKQTVRSSCGFALSHFGVQESCSRTWILGFWILGHLFSSSCFCGDVLIVLFFCKSLYHQLSPKDHFPHNLHDNILSRYLWTLLSNTSRLHLFKWSCRTLRHLLQQFHSPRFSSTFSSVLLPVLLSTLHFFTTCPFYKLSWDTALHTFSSETLMWLNTVPGGTLPRTSLVEVLHR